jgi:hypothetical protein
MFTKFKQLTAVTTQHNTTRHVSYLHERQNDRACSDKCDFVSDAYRAQIGGSEEKGTLTELRMLSVICAALLRMTRKM